MRAYPVEGVGLGLRRSFIQDAVDCLSSQAYFIEVAPENWIDIGGHYGDLFARISEQNPLVCHGLSLNLGGMAPLDEALLQKIKVFLAQNKVRCYSEHLSYCGDEGHLYDLLPIPFTEEAVRHVVGRIRQAQDILGHRVAIENISYYAAPGQEMSEIDFINAVLSGADCDLLLDVNNVYVNSINHAYDAEDFLCALSAERIAYAHVAGHYDQATDLKVDTHGADVIEPVWALLDKAYQHFGVFPTLLERDFNIPPLRQLLAEASRITTLQQKYQPAPYNHCVGTRV